MRTCFSGDPLTVDPRKCGDAVSGVFLSMLYEGLTEVLPNGELKLALAESVHISSNGKIYLFQLKDAMWSDGQPITAFDLEHSWKKTLNPYFHSTFPDLFFPIKNAEAAAQGKKSLIDVAIYALDEKTLQVELEKPTPYFLSLLSCCAFFPIPKHIEIKDPNWDAHSAQSLVSSGPFLLKKWEPKREITVKKNPLYWDAKNVSLDSLHISIIKHAFDALEMFKNGSLDLISHMLSPFPLYSIQNYPEKLTLTPASPTIFYAYNMDQFPFHNQSIRKAFSLSIDRTQLVNQSAPLNEMPAKRFVPPILDHEDVSLLPAFSPALARQALHKGFMELGILKDQEKKDDFTLRLFLQNLRLSYEDTPSNRQLVQILQEQWKQHLGYRIQLVPQNLKMQIEGIYQRDFNMALRHCAPHYNDPMSLLERFKYKNLSRNFPHFESPTYIELLNQSSQKHLSKSQRKEILLQAEAHLLEQLPIVPLYHGSYPALSQSTLSNIAFTPMGNIQFKKAKYQELKSGFSEVAVS